MLLSNNEIYTREIFLRIIHIDYICIELKPFFPVIWFFFHFTFRTHLSGWLISCYKLLFFVHLFYLSKWTVEEIISCIRLPFKSKIEWECKRFEKLKRQFKNQAFFLSVYISFCKIQKKWPKRLHYFQLESKHKSSSPRKIRGLFSWNRCFSCKQTSDSSEPRWKYFLGNFVQTAKIRFAPKSARKRSNSACTEFSVFFLLDKSDDNVCAKYHGLHNC